MTQQQACELGSLIQGVRLAKGLSQSGLARALNVSEGWVAGIERGRFGSTSPERLARITEILGIEPKQIDAITDGTVSKELPSVATYFRAKYNLSSDEIAKIVHYVKRFTERD